MKTHDFKIEIPIFKSGILVIISDKEYFTKQVEIMFPDYNMGQLRDGKCIYQNDGGYNPVLWVDSSFKKNRLIGTLSHELTHAIYWILSDRGIEHTMETEEVYCYMMQFCLEEILKEIY